MSLLIQTGTANSTITVANSIIELLSKTKAIFVFLYFVLHTGVGTLQLLSFSRILELADPDNVLVEKDQFTCKFKLHNCQIRGELGG